MIKELKYSNTNTYLIPCSKGYLLFDTDWAGTFPLFCKALGEIGVSAQDIKYIMISHFHPDHMGIAQNIAGLGATIIVADVQKEYIHSADAVFKKDSKITFQPIEGDKVKIVPVTDSRTFLDEIGIKGEILHTPGHSEDSISLFLDDGSLLVGDLNPFYEMAQHKGTRIYDSWKCLLEKNPLKVYYGHGKVTCLTDKLTDNHHGENKELYFLVKQIMKYIDKGKTLEVIQKKTKADKVFIEDVARMYLTHQGVGVQGILDRIEIKGK